MTTLTATRPTVKPIRSEAAPEIAPANPRESWPAWTDRDVWTTELDPETDGPTPEPEPAGWSLADEAWYAAFCLAMAGESPAYPALPTLAERVAFLVGRIAGDRLRQERADHDEVMGRDARFEAWVNLQDALEGHSANAPRETDGYPAGYTS